MRLGLAAETKRDIGHQRFGHGRANLFAIQSRAHRFKIEARNRSGPTILYGGLQGGFEGTTEIVERKQVMLGSLLPDMVEMHQKLHRVPGNQFNWQIVEQSPHFCLHK